MNSKELKDFPPETTNWKRVYLLVLAWFVFFNLLMYLFTVLTA